MNNTKNTIKVFAVIAILIIFAVLCVVAIINNTKQMTTINTADYTIEEYTVKAGDTLWSLSNRYKSEYEYNRAWISAVVELNSFDTTTLHIGETIQVYVSND